MDNRDDCEAETNKTINDLDVRCIDEILKYLSPNDMSAFSRTCSLYKNWTEKYFYRNPIFYRIHTNIENGRPQFRYSGYATEIYEIRFRSLFRFLSVEMEDSIWSDIFQFMKENCAKDLIHLKLWSYHRMDLSRCDGSIVAEQLKLVKALEIHCNIVFSGDIYDTLFKYCEQLRILAINLNGNYMGHQETNTTWMSHNYLRLETFVFMERKDKIMDCPEFPTFLRNNPQLRAIVTDQKSIIRSVCSTETALEYAGFMFETKYNLSKMWHHLETCAEREFVKSIELTVCEDLSYETLRKICNFNQIKSIRWMIVHDTSLVDALRELRPQSHIKTLSLTFITREIEASIPQILKCFPCLTKLWIYVNPHSDTPFKEIFMPLIAQLGSLQDLYIGSIMTIKFLADDIIDAHNERSKNNHSSPVTVHLSSRNVEFHSIIPDRSLVNVTMYKQENYSHCPFISYTFDTLMIYLNPKMDCRL